MKMIKTLNMFLGICGVVLIVTGLVQMLNDIEYFEYVVLGWLVIISSQLNSLSIKDER